MKNSRRMAIAAVLSAVLALSIVAVTPVMAATSTASVTVTGGSLSVTPAAISLTGVTLDGTDQTSTGTTTTWSAKDPTGSGAGWHITIQTTDFTKTGDATKTIAGTGFTISSVGTVTKVAGQGGANLPTSSISGGEAFKTSALTIVSAAVDKGMGSYTIQPTFALAVPAETYAGSYTATVTVSIVSTP